MGFVGEGEGDLFVVEDGNFHFGTSICGELVEFSFEPEADDVAYEMGAEPRDVGYGDH